MAGRSSIYEVFRACRLCGGGGGYKMPIVNLEDELDMRHKIRECVRIEVHQDDKMPPLICELCVDKVNDYFEFLEMCRSTDTRTRDRLGLPQPSQALAGGDADCILGVTEPVFVNDDSNDAEPLARHKNRLVVGGKGKRPAAVAPAPRRASPVPIVTITRTGLKDKMGIKELRVSMNGSREGGSRESSAARASRSGRRAPSPPPPARRSRRDDAADARAPHVKREKEKPRAPSPKETRQKGILKFKSKEEDAKSLLREKSRPHGKRDREPSEPHVAAKRVKIAIKPAAAPARAEKRRAATPPRPEPRRRAQPPAEPSPPPAPAHPCPLCPTRCSKAASLANHMKFSHSPTFTLDKLACNACGEWFRTAEEANTHHRWHRASPSPYVCRLCTAEFRQHASYAKHFASRQCVPSSEVPDAQCAVCWRNFATGNLLAIHKCKGEDARPGGNCAKCKRKFATYKTLRRHEEVCCKPGPKSKGGAFKPSPEMLRRVKPMQVRMARCDPLLARVKLERHYDVSHVAPTFGLDKSCVYPYISSVRSIKTEPHDYDLDNVKDEMFDYEDDFVNYESYTDSESEPEMVDAPRPNLVANPFARKKRSIDALSTLSIKAIFSNKFLGTKKIQRKRKRRPVVKPEIKEEKTEGEAFDALFSDPVDKETKKEMIDASNKDNASMNVGVSNEDVQAVNVESGEKSQDDGTVVAGTVEKCKEGSEDKSESADSGKIQAPMEKMFEDDTTIDEDVSSAVNDLIAGLDDIAGDKTVDSIANTDSKEDLESDKEGDKDNKNSNFATDKEHLIETTKTKDLDSEAVETTESTNSTEDESKMELDTAETLDDGKSKDRTKVKGTENGEKDGQKELLTTNELSEGNGSEVNSVFSGDLEVNSEKNLDTEKVEKKETADIVDAQNETENPKIDIRLSDEVPKADAESTLNEIRNGENSESKDRDDSVSEIVEDKVGAVDKTSSSIDTVISSDVPSLENKLDISDDRIDDKELKPQEEMNEDDLLKDSELENLSDTEMDDKELMDALDAQISNNTSHKPVNVASTDAKVNAEAVEEKQIEDPEEKRAGDAEQKNKVTDAKAESVEDTATDRKILNDPSSVIKANPQNESKETKSEERTAPEPVASEDKISLDDLLSATNKSTDQKLRESMDLDCISEDEFSFDT